MSSDELFLSKDRRQAADLGAQGGPNVLRLVGDKILDTGHDLIKQRIAVD